MARTTASKKVKMPAKIQRKIEKRLNAVEDECIASVKAHEDTLENFESRIKFNKTAWKTRYRKWNHFTSQELTVVDVNTSTTISQSILAQSILCSTTKNNTKKRLTKRSLSYTEVDEDIRDDGYLTAESRGSDKSSIGSRMSRSKCKTKTVRKSRSLSRTKLPTPLVSKSTMKTPLNKRVPQTFGSITPKVNPHLPQVVLRRPKQNEVALSLQGSPLLVNNVIADNIANVNIPLLDGRVISIQPKMGMRASQLPDLDEDTQRQIQLLRENLNKVCARF